MKVPFYEDLKNGVNSIKALLQFKNSLYKIAVLFEKSNKKMNIMKFLHEKKLKKGVLNRKVERDGWRKHLKKSSKSFRGQISFVFLRKFVGWELSCLSVVRDRMVFVRAFRNCRVSCLCLVVLADRVMMWNSRSGLGDKCVRERKISEKSVLSNFDFAKKESRNWLTRATLEHRWIIFGSQRWTFVTGEVSWGRSLSLDGATTNL